MVSMALGHGVRLPFAKLLHPGTPLTRFEKFLPKIFLFFPSITQIFAAEQHFRYIRNFCGTLFFRRICSNINTIFLGEELDSVWRKLLSIGRNAHGFEPSATRLQETIEGGVTDAGELSQLGFAVESVGVVIIDHKSKLLIIR